MSWYAWVALGGVFIAVGLGFFALYLVMTELREEEEFNAWWERQMEHIRRLSGE